MQWLDERRNRNRGLGWRQSFAKPGTGWADRAVSGSRDIRQIGQPHDRVHRKLEGRPDCEGQAAKPSRCRMNSGSSCRITSGAMSRRLRVPIKLDKEPGSSQKGLARIPAEGREPTMNAGGYMVVREKPERRGSWRATRSLSAFHTDRGVSQGSPAYGTTKKKPTIRRLRALLPWQRRELPDPSFAVWL